MKKREMFDRLLRTLTEDFTDGFRRDMTLLEASPAKIEMFSNEVLHEPRRSDWLVRIERELNEYIMINGHRLRRMLLQPLYKRAELLTDEQLHALIRDNQRQERKDRKYIQ